MKYFIIFYPLIFIIIWAFVLGLTSLIGGWYNLSKKFPYKNTKYKNGKLYRFQSVKLNYIGRYGFCINITIYDDGILLKPLLFYAFFHKPIFIEYKQFLNKQFGKFFFINFLIFNLDGKNIRIFGNSIKEIKSKLEK